MKGVTIVETFSEPGSIKNHHHVIYRREVRCGHKGCDAAAHHWMRCTDCNQIVARCGAHDHRLPDTVRGHCR
jgi:hypothetical protein